MGRKRVDLAEDLISGLTESLGDPWLVKEDL